MNDQHAHVPGGGVWTAPILAQLLAATAGNPGARALLDVAAAAPGATVTMDEVRIQSGLDTRAQISAHQVLTRTLVELFGTGLWPLERLRGNRYRMPPAVARWWRSLAGQ